MITTRTLTQTLFAILALVLAAIALWASPANAERLAGSSGTIVPDVGSVIGFELLEAGSSGTVVPDVGAAPRDAPALAGSSGTVVPDVGAAPAPGLFLAGSSGTVVPDVG